MNTAPENPHHSSIALTDDLSAIVEKIAHETGFSESDIIHHCLNFSVEHILTNALNLSDRISRETKTTATHPRREHPIIEAAAVKKTAIKEIIVKASPSKF